MSKNIYTAKLMGGLGNQMFQIANATAQGLKNGVDVLFPNYSFTPNQGKQTNLYQDNILKKVKFGTVDRQTTKIFEKTWNDSLLSYDINGNIEFNGYFQGSKNFLGFENEIKKLFSPEEHDLINIYNKYNDLNSSKKKVSIHVRRGDYLKYPDVHGVIDISYIKHCLSLLENFDIVYVFSDDKDWVIKNLSDNKTLIVDGLQDYEELWMMSLCDINIMSCSSFSWWASYLNENKDKKIFVPDKWFGPMGTKVYDNIFEKEWLKINVKYTDGKLLYEKN